MASLYKRNESIYWWIKYRNVTTKETVRESTGYRFEDPIQNRKAHDLKAQRTLDEKFAPAETAGAWDTWVETFIKSNLTRRSQERYITAWRTIRMWLDHGKITEPKHVTYKFCCTYVPWRLTPDKRNGKYKAVKNTAILEFKIFRWLMREAVKQEFCSGNPAREVVLKKEPRKEFPDLTDAQLKKIYTTIMDEPDQTNRIRLQRSFAVSLLQGVRLNETNVNPMTDVKFDEIPTIRFVQKGNRERFKPLHPHLFGLFKALQEEKATQTYPMIVKDGRLRWSDRWTQFWERRGFKEEIKNVCFHSLRITVENVLRESGIEVRTREMFLTHEGQTTINARYDRVKIREMVACLKPLNRRWLTI